MRTLELRASLTLFGLPFAAPLLRDPPDQGRLACLVRAGTRRQQQRLEVAFEAIKDVAQRVQGW